MGLSATRLWHCSISSHTSFSNRTFFACDDFTLLYDTKRSIGLGSHLGRAGSVSSSSLTVEKVSAKTEEEPESLGPSVSADESTTDGQTPGPEDVQTPSGDVYARPRKGARVTFVLGDETNRAGSEETIQTKDPTGKT